MTFLALPIILTLRPREAAPMFVSFKILEQIPFSLLTHFSVCSNSHLLMCIWGSSSHAYLENKGADVHLCWRSSLVNAIPRIHLAFLLSHFISWVFFQLFFSSGEGKKKKKTPLCTYAYSHYCVVRTQTEMGKMQSVEKWCLKSASYCKKKQWTKSYFYANILKSFSFYILENCPWYHGNVNIKVWVKNM